MQIIHKIDQLITELNDLKPNLGESPLDNKAKFNSLLQSAMGTVDHLEDKSSGSISETKIDSEKKISDEVPSWVDPNYSYDPKNPRKPNMRELMEALAGKSLQELYAEGDSKSKKISTLASELLYGVVGSNDDTRDWSTIMASPDVLKSAQLQTAKMYEPVIEVISHFDNESILVGQTAVVKNKGGDILRSLSDDISSTEETLKNFGATNKSIPDDIEARVDPSKFNKDLLTLLKDFDQHKNSTEELVFQTATDAISKKLSADIPLEELEKL